MSKILIQNIFKSYGDKVIFEDFSLELDSNKNTSILGISGQGKTTLLNLLAGIENLDKGIIDKGKLKFSYVFQEPVLLPWATVYENIKYVSKSKNDDSKIMETLEKLSIQKEVNAYPNELSGGMKQRVALARAVMYEADVILMDEPFQNLDADCKKRTLKLYRELMQNSNINFILVSHNIEEALGIADNILVLKGDKNREAIFYKDKKSFNNLKI